MRQASWSKETSRKLKSAILTLLQIVTIACLQATPIFADETGVNPPTGGGGDHANGGEEGGNNDTSQYSNGFRQGDGGYRCYMEDKNGNIVQAVVDFYFDKDYRNGAPNPLPTDQAIDYGRTTALGGRSLEINPIPYGPLEQKIPGLRPPIYNHQPWGAELNAWFESDTDVSGVSKSNAELFIATVFGVVGEPADEYIYQYQLGNYRIVVEGVYWYNLADKDNKLVKTSDGKIRYVYGTARDIALYNQTASISGIPVNDLISKHPERRIGGEHLNAYTNDLCVKAVMFVEDDEFSGFIVPNLPTTEYGKYTYETILADKQGWDMIVVWKEQVSEKWATWDSTKYGGYQEASPGVAPKQPEIPGVDNTKIHPVTIIKYYELEKVELDSSGKKKTVYETVTGPTRQTKICMTIDVQTEPGWILRRHFQAKEDVHAAKWLDISSSIKYKQRFGASTVEMEVESGYKYLYVWHVKVDNTPPAI